MQMLLSRSNIKWVLRLVAAAGISTGLAGYLLGWVPAVLAFSSRTTLKTDRGPESHNLGFNHPHLAYYVQYQLDWSIYDRGRSIDAIDKEILGDRIAWELSRNAPSKVLGGKKIEDWKLPAPGGCRDTVGRGSADECDVVKIYIHVKSGAILAEIDWHNGLKRAYDSTDKDHFDLPKYECPNIRDTEEKKIADCREAILSYISLELVNHPHHGRASQ